MCLLLIVWTSFVWIFNLYYNSVNYWSWPRIYIKNALLWKNLTGLRSFFICKALLDPISRFIDNLVVDFIWSKLRFPWDEILYGVSSLPQLIFFPLSEILISLKLFYWMLIKSLNFLINGSQVWLDWTNHRGILRNTCVVALINTMFNNISHPVTLVSGGDILDWQIFVLVLEYFLLRIEDAVLHLEKLHLCLPLYSVRPIMLRFAFHDILSSIKAL